MRKKDLSRAESRLIELMQSINFGTLENLTLCAGQPQFNPGPRVIRTFKMGGDDLARKERELLDYELKVEQIDVIRRIRQLGDCIIASIKIEQGLPRFMNVEGGE